MSCENKLSLYEEAKKSLTKLKGSDTGLSSSSTSIKLEPAFLVAMNKPCLQLDMSEEKEVFKTVVEIEANHGS